METTHKKKTSKNRGLFFATTFISNLFFFGFFNFTKTIPCLYFAPNFAMASGPLYTSIEAMSAVLILTTLA
jgi:hypothetical protein